MSSELNERAQSLLKILVEHYLEDGQPVGSRTLSRDSGMQLSPATVRNVMSDLEESGFIKSPHTSAGRVPTTQGYRFFVDTLISVQPVDEQQVQDLRYELSADLDPQLLMHRATELLTGVTGLASMVSIPRCDSLNIKHIEFIGLSDRRLLVVIVMNNDEVENRIIHTDRSFQASELTEMANFLNSRFSGKDLRMVREQVIREMKAERESANELMLAAIAMAEEISNAGSDGDFIMQGETKLMDFADITTVERLKTLFDAFRQKQEILHLLDRCLQADGIQIFIGKESGYSMLNDWSLVSAPYTVEGEQVGVLGVIGPTRMAYDRVIPMVDITARLLGSALKSG